MSHPCAFQSTIRLLPLALICCALWSAMFGESRSADAQATKPPTMGSAGMTGGSIPSTPENTDSPQAAAQPPATQGPEAKPESPTPRVPPATNPPPRQGRDAPASPATTIPLTDNGIPPFHLARLSLDGEVTGDRAIMSVQIDVDVNRDQGGYHDVPLRFTQAHILSKEYDGPGMEGPVVDGPVEDGIVWRFTGHGTHHLTLNMWVPIRQSPAGRQLILSLPTMPPGFDAQLNLKIAGPLVVIRSGRELSVLSNERVGELNQVSANVWGPRLEMTWSEPPEVQTSFLQATTTVTLHREGDRVIAIAEQILLPENVGEKDAEIKLPDGFELDELTGLLVKGHEAILGRTGWRKVSFRETSGEPIVLNWVLSAPFSANGGTLQFDGLVIPDARSQVGRIRLQDFPGYQMVPRPGEFVRRAPSTSPQTTETFEFTKQPFRITWDVQRVIPKFSVRPRHVLFVGSGQLILESRFRFQTDSGSLDQAELILDSADAEGWRLSPASVTGEATVSSKSDQLSQNGRLLIGWKTPQSGSFDLSLRFERALATGTETARVALPQVRGARSQTADLFVAAEDQLDVNIQGVDRGALPQLALDPRRMEGIAPALINQIQRNVTLDPGRFQIDLNWKVQTRIVEADTETELRRAADGRIRVQQRVKLQVRFGRLSTVRFQVPKSLATLIPAGAAVSAIGVTIDGQPVTPQLRDGVIEAPLREARMGEILTTLEYSIPLSTDSSRSANVPVLQSLDAKSASIRVRIPEGEPLRIPPSAEGWQPVPTSPDATVWVASSATQVPVILDADQTTSPRFRMDLAFYRTRFDQAGLIEAVCEFHWKGDVRGLPVTLPPESELLGVMYNGQDLNATPGQVVADASNPSQFVFRLPPTREGSRLALLYRSLQKTQFSHRDIRSVPLPQLPPDVSIVRSIWELELPVGRHLFMGPGDLTPEHQWRRKGLLWSRQPVESYLAERELATTEARQFTPRTEPGEVYAFSSIGPIVAPRFQSMTRSLILLLGAGLTLAMGFLFWSLPVTRNMLALLLIAFGVSLLSLWFLEPIQLLLQPAVLGAVLAILASWIDFRSRRPTLSAFPVSVMPIPGPLPNSGELAVAGRGSSVSRHQMTPMSPTAVYQPDNSEMGSP